MGTQVPKLTSNISAVGTSCTPSALVQRTGINCINWHLLFPRGKPMGDWFIPRICLVNRDAEKRELEPSSSRRPDLEPLLGSFSWIHLELVFPLWLHLGPGGVHQNTAYSTVTADEPSFDGFWSKASMALETLGTLELFACLFVFAFLF